MNCPDCNKTGTLKKVKPIDENKELYWCVNCLGKFLIKYKGRVKMPDDCGCENGTFHYNKYGIGICDKCGGHVNL
jgi:transposase-like protein